MTAIFDIANLLEAGKEGAWINAEVFRALDYDVAVHTHGFRYRRHIKRAPWERIPAVSNSLDAVERLREEILPGSEATLFERRCRIEVLSPDGWSAVNWGDAPTRCGAYLAALLRAWEAQQ